MTRHRQPAAAGRRRPRRGDGRVQPGARGGARTLRARLRRRHVEHGDRRGAARRAQRDTSARVGRRRLRPGAAASCGRDEGVDTRGVATDPAAPTGVYFVTHGPHGSRVLVPARGLGGVADRARRRCRTTSIRGARVLHVSGISQAISASACDAVFAADRRRAGRRRAHLLRSEPAPKLWPLPRARAVIWRRSRNATGSCRASTRRSVLSGLRGCRGRSSPGAMRTARRSSR